MPQIQQAPFKHLTVGENLAVHNFSDDAVDEKFHLKSYQTVAKINFAAGGGDAEVVLPAASEAAGRLFVIHVGTAATGGGDDSLTLVGASGDNDPDKTLAADTDYVFYSSGYRWIELT